MTAAVLDREKIVSTSFGHGLTAVTAEAEKFHALPRAERERILDEFKDAFSGVFASVDEYLAEKRREASHDGD